MERWSGRVAMVTGSSAGIGAEIAKELVRHGMNVVGVARRVENIQGFSDELLDAPGKLFPLKADVSKENEVLDAFSWIKHNLGGVDVLINNAGILKPMNLTANKKKRTCVFRKASKDSSMEEFRQMLDLNVVGLSVCTREAVVSMRERGVDDGHIIHINSLAGHSVFPYAGLYPYTASKYAVTALTEGLRKELVAMKSRIKVTSISPGGVDTDLVRNIELGEEIDMSEVPLLQPKDIADAVVYVLGTPSHVQVHELMIRPVLQLH